jgi:hypothetical protein
VLDGVTQQFLPRGRGSGQDQAQLGSILEPCEGIQEDEVILVGIGRGRVQEERAGDPIAGAEATLIERLRREAGREPVGHDGESSRIDVVRVDERGGHELRRRGDHAGSGQARRELVPEPRQLHRADVLGVGHVLDVVHRQDDGNRPRSGSGGAARVVQQRGTAPPDLRRQPCPLDGDPHAAPLAIDRRHDDLVPIGKLGMGGCETRKGEERQVQVRRLRGERSEYPRDVLLGAAHLPGHAPEQVHGDSGHYASTSL